MKLKLVFILLISFATTLQAQVGYKIGNTAPDFLLKDLSGKKHSLAKLRENGPVLLVFWAVECVYCYAHIKVFNKAYDDYKAKLTIAAINIDGEQDEQIREYVSDNGLKYLTLSDRLKNIDVAESYHVIGTPTIVLVSKQGQILFYGHHMPKLAEWIK